MRSSLASRSSLIVAGCVLFACPGWTTALRSRSACDSKKASQHIVLNKQPLTKFGLEESEEVYDWGGSYGSQLLTVALETLDRSTGPRLALVVYLWSSSLVALFVVSAYWSYGLLTIARILLYLLSSAAIKMTVKLVFETHSFAFPKFLSTLHVATSAVFGFGILLSRRLRYREEIKVPTLSEFFVLLLPLSLGFTYAVGAGNGALVFCTAGFVEIISSATPLFSVVLLVITGQQFPLKLCPPLFVMIVGCVVTIRGDLGFSAAGLAWCLLSNLGRSVKVVLQQRLLSGDLGIKYDFATLLAWMCGTSLPMLVVWCCATEGRAPFQQLASEAHLASLCLSMIPSCILATVMNYSHLLVVNDLGAVGIQVAAQTKSVLTILGGLALFHETLSPWGMVGYALVMCAAFFYARTDATRKAEAAKGEIAGALSPKELDVEAIAAKIRDGVKVDAQAEVQARAGPTDDCAKTEEKAGRPRLEALAGFFRARSCVDTGSWPPCLRGIGYHAFIKTI